MAAAAATIPHRARVSDPLADSAAGLAPRGNSAASRRPSSGFLAFRTSRDSQDLRLRSGTPTGRRDAKRSLFSLAGVSRSSRTGALDASSDSLWYLKSRDRGTRVDRKGGRAVSCNAMEAMRDVFLFDSRDSESLSDSLVGSNPGLPDTSISRFFPPANRADDVSLNNPLLRLNRMGCGWLAVILEWEGVIVEDDVGIERRAWIALAEEEGKQHPMAFILKRIEGMKKEHAIAEVLCWSRDYKTMKKLATRHEEIYQGMQGGCYRLRPGAKEFIENLKHYNIPIAIASTRPKQSLERAIEAVGLEGVFDVVLASEDVYRGKPDPEMFEYAAQKLDYIPERCVVIGNSNISVEAAHDALMKCVAVAGKHPAYELNAAELVVRRLDELSIVDLKNLVAVDSPEFLPSEPVPELELEPELENKKTTTTFANWF